MRSASPAVRVAASASVALAAGTAVAGCDTTQQKSERAQVKAQRALATREVVVVRRRHPAVKVTAVSTVRGRGGAAVAVRLRSRAGRPLNDLPISVGVRTPDGRPVVLNRRAGLPYFQTHAPVLAAGGAVTWVYAPPGPVPAGRPFARVGLPSAPRVDPATALPRLDVDRLAGSRATVLRARVRNPTDVPQYRLEVYAYGLRGARYVAAGRAAIRRLGGGGSTTVAVRLRGRPRGAALRLEVPPTVFR